MREVRGSNPAGSHQFFLAGSHRFEAGSHGIKKKGMESGKSGEEMEGKNEEMESGVQPSDFIWAVHCIIALSLLLK